MEEYSVFWENNYDDAYTTLGTTNASIIHLDNDLSDPEDRQGKHLFNYIEYLLHEGRLESLKEVRIHSDNSSSVVSMMTAKDIFQEKYNVLVSQVIYKS